MEAIQAGALLLAVACVYGLVLEILNMHVFRTYHYNSGFIRVLGAPLIIGPLWGLIVISSMRLSDGLGSCPMGATIVRWRAVRSDRSWHGCGRDSVEVLDMEYSAPRRLLRRAGQ